MIRAAFLLTALLSLTACGTSYRDTTVPITAQADFDPARYTGLWYEIARFPVFFQKGCTAVTARYGALPDGKISVLNSCHMNAPDGPLKTIAGNARIVAPGQLEVRFDTVPFVRGDYWVLWVDPDYQLAVVGVPSGKAGWILSRTPRITPEALDKARTVLRDNGYNPDALTLTEQPTP